MENEKHSFGCASHEGGECNCEVIKLSDMTPEQAYSLGKCEGTFNESKKWSEEMVPAIKEGIRNSTYEGIREIIATLETAKNDDESFNKGVPCGQELLEMTSTNKEKK